MTILPSKTQFFYLRNHLVAYSIATMLDGPFSSHQPGMVVAIKPRYTAMRLSLLEPVV
jgi:hypothetical protein